MILKLKWLFVVPVFIIFAHNVTFSQEKDVSRLLEVSSVDTDSVSDLKNKFERLVFFDFRGTNVFEAAIGSSALIGDFEDSSSGFYFKVGYKRSVTDHLFFGLAFNKYRLAYNDISQDLVSFDFNIEYLVFPYKDLSPFLYSGFGYNALSDFELNAVKVQAGFGFEYIVSEGIGLKLFAEYNYSLDDDVDFLINDKENDSFLRIGAGVNLYFGGNKQKEKRLSKIPTQIKTNSILQDN
ncbi:MAG: Curli production assembly/transport component CsgG [Winogradskyella sp.]